MKAKQGANAATPRLRFPEFQNSEPWPETDLGAVLFEHGAKDDGTSEVHSVSVHKGVVNQIEHLGRSFAAADRSKYNLVKPYDVVYTKSPTGDFPFGIVKQSRVPSNAIVSPLYGVFSPSNRYIGCLLDAYFESPNRANLYLAPIAQKGAKNTIQISNEMFLSKGIFLPEQEDEQRKIAGCMTSLDEVIAAQGRKVEALKVHKRGLMQQLFPREGEARPRLRFPEFRNAPEWTQETLGETADVLMCKRVFASETNPCAGVPFYKIGTLGGEPDAYISRELFEEYSSRYNFPKSGEVLITCSGTVGKCLRYDGSDAYFQDSNIVWIDNPTGAISNDFLFALISNVDWGKLNSTTITRIYGPDLRNLTIKYPKNCAEQQRITDCLTSIDAQISGETNQLAAFKSHKQGLMQQLFPAPDAAIA